jgi:hypothetical protein
LNLARVSLGYYILLFWVLRRHRHRWELVGTWGQIFPKFLRRLGPLGPRFAAVQNETSSTTHVSVATRRLPLNSARISSLRETKADKTSVWCGGGCAVEQRPIDASGKTRCACAGDWPAVCSGDVDVSSCQLHPRLTAPAVSHLERSPSQRPSTNRLQNELAQSHSV